MEEESQFIKNIKAIPLEIGDIDSDIYIPIKKANTLITQGKGKEASLLLLETIEEDIKNISEKTKEIIPRKMLVVSEIPDINDDIRDLSLDLMLSVEEDSLNQNDFILRIKQIRDTILL